LGSPHSSTNRWRLTQLLEAGFRLILSDAWILLGHFGSFYGEGLSPSLGKVPQSTGFLGFVVGYLVVV